jgi:hypothetical protein
LYYVLALYNVRGAINTPLPSILKDKDYVSAFALGGHCFVNKEGKKMKGQELSHAQEALRADWVENNPELAASLEGKDYKSQYEQVRARAGFEKAKTFIKGKARASSVPAHRFKFLWVSKSRGTGYCSTRSNALTLFILGAVSCQTLVL